MAKELTSKSYIDHHLTNLTCGKTESVGWTCDHNYYDEMGFMAFHVDSIAISVLLGIAFVALFKLIKLNPADQRIHRYFPDFYIKVRDNDGKAKKYIIEIKPKKQFKQSNLTQLP